MKEITNDDAIKGWGNIAKESAAFEHEEGDKSRRYLLNPAIFELVGNIDGKKILDAGCGNGYLSRMLIKKGATVTGVEPAKPLIEYAINREKEESLGINYIEKDLCDYAPDSNNFDIVISNMVFMDIPDYQKAMKVCIDCLKPGGTLVFSLLHPCFDESNREGAMKWREARQVVVKEYQQNWTSMQTCSYLFHRTLSQYLNTCIDLGTNIVKIIEPKLTEEQVQEMNYDKDMYVPTFIVVKVVKK